MGATFLGGTFSRAFRRAQAALVLDEGLVVFRQNVDKLRSLGGASCLGGTYVHVICFVDKKVIEHAHSLNDRVPSPTDLHNTRHSDCWFLPYQSQ